jgi:hypothetical protein
MVVYSANVEKVYAPFQENTQATIPEIVAAGPITQARLGVDAHGHPVETEVVNEFQLPKLKKIHGQVAAALAMCAFGVIAAQVVTKYSKPTSMSIPSTLQAECPGGLTQGNPLPPEKLSAVSSYLKRAAADLKSELGNPLCQTPPVATSQGQDERVLVYQTEVEGQFALFNVVGFGPADSKRYVVNAANVVQIP